jgi:hypothetical protein
MTMTFIEEVTLATAAANLTITSIPQDYTDLLILFTSRTDRGDAAIDAFFVEVNGSGISSGVSLFGTGSSAQGNTDHPFTIGNTATADTFASASIYIPNYTVAQAHAISIDSVGENNASSSPQGITTNITTSTAAVTSIELDPETGSNFVAGTTATVYGITSGGDGTVTTA